jgi:hypothetical protein
MSPFVKYFFRAIIIILLQYVLSNITPLGGYITPYMYFVYILWLPFTMSRFWLLVVAALYGLAFGYLIWAPGLHAAACVLIAYLRPFLLSILLPKEVKEMNYMEPSYRSMGFSAYAVYAILLTIIHHCYLIFLQWLSVGNLGFFFIKAILTSIISILLIGVMELIFVRTKKTRASLN